MNDVQKAIFPGLLMGVVLIFFTTRLIAVPTQPVSAQSEPAAVQAEVQPVATGEPTLAPKKAVQKPKAKPTAMPTHAPQPTDQPAPEPADAPAAQAQPQDQTGCSLSAAYPESIRQWCAPIEGAAAEHGLDPNLIAALMLQESGGDPNSYSSAGAVGLMQVMPNDGLAAEFMCGGGPCFANRPSSAELFDPTYNIQYGTQFLAGLISSHGSLRDGLLYYGPTGMGYEYADKVLAILANYR